MTALGTGYRRPEYLVETDWLEQHLDDPGLRVFDCTVIAKPNTKTDGGFPFVFENGRGRFNETHVPGAGFLDLLGALSDASSPLPFPMPAAAQFAEAVGNAGIDDASRVVLYATAEPIWAARVWWLLRAFGFDNAAVLNGGWAKWRAEGRPESARPCAYPPGCFSAQPRPRAVVGKAEVLAAIGDPTVCTINALPTPVYTGVGGPVFGRRGRIAGSANVPFTALNDQHTGAYLPADRLRAEFDAVNAGDAARIVAYCGSGIAAANDALALALLGYENVAVYDASMAEWGYDETLPMEAG